LIHVTIPQVVNLQAELTYLQGHLATTEVPTPPPFAGQPQMPMTAAFSSVSNLPSSSNVPASVDLSTLFDSQTQSQQWAFQFQQQQILQQQHHHHHQQQQQQQLLLLQQQQYLQMGEGSNRGASGSGTLDDGGDLQALAMELQDRRQRMAVGSPPKPPTPATQ